MIRSGKIRAWCSGVQRRDVRRVQHGEVRGMEYPELGVEAVWKVEVEDFPAFVVIDDKGRTSSPRPPRRPCT
jgi:tartrate dehydratase beta subunit/fumarate hydratase class I family protein